MLKDKIKEIGKHDGNNKKKIENIIFLVIILILVIIFMNIILKEDKNLINENNNTVETKVLADKVQTNLSDDSLERNLENILSSIKGVGEVNVFISYSESSKTVAMYDEKTTVSSTEENDSSGGVRNITATETQKDVIFSDNNGVKIPVTEKTIKPIIEGAIITAKGAENASVKANIINAVKAATGLSIDKIQVFEMQ